MVFGDYVIARDIVDEIDLPVFVNSCETMYAFIKENFSHMKADYNGQSTMTTKLYAKYNLFMYPHPEFRKLYKQVQKIWNDYNQEPDGEHYVQCWLNLYRDGEFIDWHGHWPKEQRTWHGFFVASAGGESSTTYSIPGKPGYYDVPSKDGRLVLSPSDDDKHRQWPWSDQEKCRITCAFDIVPRDQVPTHAINHWVPI